MPEHSPLPWVAWNEHGGRVMKNWRVGSRGKTDGVVTPVCVLDNSVTGYEEYANAQFIEKACNSYYEMLDALEAVEKAGLLLTDGVYETVMIALAKAKGELPCS